MKSRTSFSNLTIFKKDLTRFAPLWALYLAGMLLVLIGNAYGSYDSFARHNMGDMILGFGIVNLIYAGLCVVVLFGDLYNTRMCYSLHTVPLRREGLFLNHCAAALCISLGPNLIASLLLMVILENYWFLALYWLLAATLQFLCFFGIAVFSAMLTGSRFAMLLVYAGLNFVSMLGYWIINSIYLPWMEGVILDFKPFQLVCPVVYPFDHFEFFRFESIPLPNYDRFGTDVFYQYIGLADGWGYLAIWGVVGVALSAAALLLYKARHLECAGDFVAFPRLKGSASIIMTVCIAGASAFIGKELLGSAMVLWLLVGLVLGYFGSLMLLERRVKVFRKKSFLSFGILAATLGISALLIAFDVFGIVHWTPSADQVQSVTISNYKTSSYDLNYMPYPGSSRISVTLDQAQQIEQVITAHQDILSRLDEDPSHSHRITIRYQLKNGQTVIRSYVAPADGVNYEIFRELFYTPQNILGYTDWDAYLKQVCAVSIHGDLLPEGLWIPVLEALREDCEAGRIVVNSKVEAAVWMFIEKKESNGSVSAMELEIPTTATKTMQLLNTPEVFLHYEQWDTFLEQLDSVMINGTPIRQEQFAPLMEALRADCEAGILNYSNTGPYADFSIDYHTSGGQGAYRYMSIPINAEKTIAWYKENFSEND